MKGRGRQLYNELHCYDNVSSLFAKSGGLIITAFEVVGPEMILNRLWLAHLFYLTHEKGTFSATKERNLVCV